MDMIRRLIEYLWHHHAEVRPIALEFSPFGKLPHELILLIASYLPLESAAILSLSCRSLYACLETQCLRSLKESEYSIINEFLRLLEQDLPTHIVCPHCNALHSMSFAEHHLPSRRYSLVNKPSLACWIADLGSDINWGVHLEFSSSIFRMAKKAHRQGLDTTKLLDLLSYENNNILCHGFVEQRTATARIQDDSLLLREQSVFMVPSSQKVPLPWIGSIDICSHIQFATMSSLHKYGVRVPLGDKIKGYENRQGIIYCEHCYTEFRVDFKSYGEGGNAMFVTKWMDIGEGRDLRDYKWRSRLGGFGQKTWIKVAFPRGSNCAAFEQKTEFKFDSLLTQQSEKELCTKSPWPWPGSVEVSYDRVSQYSVVIGGRLVRF